MRIHRSAVGLLGWLLVAASSLALAPAEAFFHVIEAAPCRGRQ
jgi:hypothetical protein